ncbi:hypothetical protein [Mycobacterium asiaticum]|uniref:hypothetical protein n=1 Tax=Mycobacterium asiaticum TaxID=1790 RepID=UPI0012DB6267|nr:hypothetical protein [Mycobacterium asiaticum]
MAWVRDRGRRRRGALPNGLRLRALSLSRLPGVLLREALGLAGIEDDPFSGIEGNCPRGHFRVLSY